jgi:pyrroline-5-carboxylate reductase
MGAAFCDAWTGLTPSPILTIVDPHTDAADYATLDALPESAAFDAVFVAVKPQTLPEVLPLLSQRVTDQTLVISIAAGVKLSTYRKYLKGQLVRAMPNTPAAIGKGVTAAYGEHGLSDAATLLLGATGTVITLSSETLFDAVTAVSGSGPAYVFHLVEALAQAGEDAGLPSELAAALARQTVIGAGALLEARNGKTPAELRQSVTSPNGTTAAGLAVLMPELTRLMTDTVEAASARSKELGQ